MKQELVSVAQAIEDAAMAAGSQWATLPFDEDMARSLIRSRRLRVLDWLAQSGFSLLNVLPGVEEEFLSLFEEHTLQDKYAAARLIWESLRPTVRKVDPSGWIEQVGEAEVLLIEVRRPRRAPQPPASHLDPAQLVPEAHLADVDMAALEIHDSLPTYDMPGGQRARVLETAAKRSGRPVPGPVLAVGPVNHGDGLLIGLDAEVAQVLPDCRQPQPWGAMQRLFAPEIADALLAHQLIASGGGALP